MGGEYKPQCFWGMMAVRRSDTDASNTLSACWLQAAFAEVQCYLTIWEANGMLLTYKVTFPVLTPPLLLLCPALATLIPEGTMLWG